MFRSVFKLILLFLIISNCDNIPRDNLLDPKNDDSYRKSVILLEAFVNTTYDYPLNFWALEALDSIEAIYGERIVIAEYHRNIKVGDSLYADPYANTQDQFDMIHQNYVDVSLNTFERAIPDIYINGTYDRILGASSVHSVIDRLTPGISELINEKTYFTIEADISASTDTTVSIKCKIARLGNQSEKDLQLNWIFIKDHKQNYLKRVVEKVSFLEPENIEEIKAGEYVEEEIGPITFSSERRPDAVILTITKRNNLEVLQTFRKVIQW